MTANTQFRGSAPGYRRRTSPAAWLIAGIFVLAALSATFWYAYRESTHEIIHFYLNRANQQTQLAAELTDTQVKHVINHLQTIAPLSEVVELDAEGRRQLDMLLRESQPWAVAVCRLSPAGQVLYAAPPSKLKGGDAQHALFAEVAASRQPLVSRPLTLADGSEAVAISVPTQRNGSAAGCLAVLLNHRQLAQELILPLKPRGLGQMLVLDSYGNVISYPGLRRSTHYESAFAGNASLQALAGKLVKGQSAENEIANDGMFADLPNSAPVLISEARTRFSATNNWIVCSLVPREDVLVTSPSSRWPYFAALLYVSGVLLLALTLVMLQQGYRGALEREVAQRTLELQESEERYRYLVDRMGEGVMVADERHRIVYANTALADTLYTTPDYLAGRGLREFVVEFELPAFDALEERVRQGHSAARSFTVRACNGLVRLVDYAGHPRLDSAGKYIGLFGLVSDVTEQAKTESALSQERQLFTEGLVVTFKWALLENWRADFISPNIAQFGYRADEFQSGRINFWDIIHHDDLARMKQAFVEAAASGVSSLQSEYRIMTADGDTRWVFDYTKVLRDAAGKPAHHLGYIIDITRRRQAEEGLKQQQFELQAITRAFPDLYFRQDASGAFLDFVAVADDDGPQPLHFLGKEHIGMMPKHVVEKLNDALREVITTQQLQSVEYSLHTGRQQQFFEARIVPMDSNQVLGIIRNITERRRGEMVQAVLLNIAETAAHTEDLHELLAAIHRELGQLINVTNFYVALYNERSESFEFPFHVDERDEDFRPQRLQGSLTDYVRRTGQPLFVDRATHQEMIDQGLVGVVGPIAPVWLGAPLKVAGQVIGVVAVQDYRDAQAFSPRDLELLSYVTEHLAISINRKTAEEALRKSEESYRRLVEVARESIVTVDEREVITFANRAFCQALSYTKEELIGRSLLSLLTERSAAEVVKATEDRRAGRTTTYEIDFVAASGEHVSFLSTATPLTDEAGNFEGTLAVMVDITERKAAAEAMLQTQKLESLGVMAGGIAHDFNNLLVGILGNAGLALNEVPPNSPAYQYIQDLERASQRAADLTRQMLAYSGKGKLVTAPFNVSAVVEEMSRLLKAVIPKSVVLELALEDRLPAVSGDVAQFRQVVMNLIINAAEAIGDRSGYINVSTGTVYVDRELTVALHKSEELASGEYVFVEVADNGSGMEQAALERVFDPFFTTKFTGRGLGLAVVLGIVRSHKGAIQVSSKLGAGTSFRVLLPASDEPGPGHETNDVDALSWRGEGTVLVVDDEPAIRTVTKNILARIGMKAVLARDGKEGTRMFEEMADQIDLVILDLTMPRMSGEEALQHIREIRPQVKVLLTSGYSEQDAVSRFADDALAGFLQKPYTVSDLVDKIRGIMEDKAQPKV